MRVYFDTCCLQRPLDDKVQLRVAVESEAILGLLAKCEASELDLISSEVLVLEVQRCYHPEQRAYVASILEKAQTVVVIDPAIQRRATELEARGFHGFDALHLASAEAGRADVLCSCDDRFLKKARRQTDLSVRVASPLELADEVL